MRRSRFRVHVLALRDCTAFVPIGIVDMLRKAAMLPGARRAVEVVLVAPGGSPTVVGAGGIRIRCGQRLDETRDSDLVVVPAVDPDVVHHLDRNRAVVPWLRERYARGADVASVCTGAFLLGEAGLLDHRAATTHWAFQDQFARRYPRVRLLPQAILVDQGRVLTSGGATSFLNLSLHLVERVFGVDVARAASKMFLVDINKAPQSAYAMFASQKTHDDRDVLRAQQMIEDRPSRVPPVEQLARAVAMSPRTFARRFRNATGNSPLEYTQRVKIEAAKRALETGERIASVAGSVGYSDAASFRRLFARITGLSPADYRARYGPAYAPSTIAFAKRTRATRR
jgi:transcriptional regulator GlxA family with amidase domain